MSIVSGIVERMSHNEEYGTYGILVAGTWYNSKFPIKCEVGDSVIFENGGKRYCNKLRVTTSAETSESAGNPTPTTGPEAVLRESATVPINRDRCILRQNALAHATEVVTSYIPAVGDEVEEVANTIISVAKILEGYSSGDDDLLEIEKRLKE